jgi:hypothetical protein
MAFLEEIEAEETDATETGKDSGPILEINEGRSGTNGADDDDDDEWEIPFAESESTPIESEVLEIRLHKEGDERLGLVLDELNFVVMLRELSPAARSGELEVGDEILEVCNLEAKHAYAQMLPCAHSMCTSASDTGPSFAAPVTSTLADGAAEMSQVQGVEVSRERRVATVLRELADAAVYVLKVRRPLEKSEYTDHQEHGPLMTAVCIQRAMPLFRNPTPHQSA